MNDSNGRVEIFTDGACSGNPGPGGWGVLLRWNGTEKELKGGEPETTNNRMELMAAVQALETRRICIPTAPMSRRALPSGFIRGKSAAGKPPPKNRSRTKTCGGAWTTPFPGTT